MAEDTTTEETCAVCGKPAVTTVTIQVKAFLGPDTEPGEQKYVPLCPEHAMELEEIGVEAFVDKYFRNRRGAALELLKSVDKESS